MTRRHSILLPLMMTPLALTLSLITPAYSATVPAGVQLAEKQELVRNNGTEVQSVDPHKVAGVPESNVIRDLLEGLVVSGEKGQTLPAVATSWQTEDSQVWVFHLRDGAKWSNGDPITAEDFVYSWQRLATPNTAAPYSSYLKYAHILNAEEVISGKMPPSALGVKALDAKRLQVTLSEPVPYLVDMLIHQSVTPVHRATIEKYGDRWTRPENFVGNGAFKLKNWVVNERLVIERNSNYWNDKETVLDQVTFLPIASEVTDVNRYRSGEIDITFNSLPIELYQKLKRELPNELYNYPSLCSYYYGINNKKAPFNDLRVRTALKLGLEQDILTNRVKNQGDNIAFGFSPPIIGGINSLEKPEWATWSQTKRNQEAKKLLAEAGFNKKNPLTFSLLYNTSDLHKKLAIAASSIWQKNLGVRVKLENQEWKTFLDTRRQGQYDIARMAWCADYNEASSFLNILLSSSSNNDVFYASKTFDNLMKQAIQAKIPQERAELYQAAETELDKDSAIIPVFYYMNSRLIKPHVGGYSTNNPLDYNYSRNLYMIKK